MNHEPTTDFDERVILGLLLDHDRLSDDELTRELGGGAAGVRVEDALAGLDRAGLAHRRDGFAWATRAAVRAVELAA